MTVGRRISVSGPLLGCHGRKIDCAKIPRSVPEGKPALVGDDGASVGVAVNTESAKGEYEAKMEKYEKTYRS